jgi:hypothetical protein
MDLSGFFAEFFSSLAYSVFGFFLGWVVGYEARRLEEWRDPMIIKERLLTSRNGFAGGKLGLFLVMLSLLTVLQSAYFSWEQRQSSECFADYNEAFSTVQTLRAGWIDSDRQALIDFLSIYDGSEPSPEEARDALNQLTDKYENVSRLREDTPLPVLPDCAP